MNNKKNFAVALPVFIVGLLTCCTSNLFAADPVLSFLERRADGSLAPEQNFYEIRARFYAQFGDSIGAKGSGWKHFKRWEYFWQSRVNADGSFPDASVKHLNALEYARAEAAKRSGSDVVLDASGEWTPLGPFSTSELDAGDANAGIGRINVVSFHPMAPDLIWIGSASGGAWKSLDRGKTWRCMTLDLPQQHFSDFAFDPNDPDVVYMASGDRSSHAWGAFYFHSLGVYKSTDGGETWSNTGLAWNTEEQAANEYRMIFRLLVDPQDGNRVYVGSNHGIYRSLDAGVNFDLLSDAAVWDMEFKPDDPRTLYAVTRRDASSAETMISRDGGTSWTAQGVFDGRGGLPHAALEVTPAAPEMVYIAIASNWYNESAVYRSVNAGRDWQFRGSIEPGGAWGFPLGVSNVNPDEIWAGGVLAARSVDAGRTWEPFRENLHGDHHYFAYHPHDNEFFAASDGGLYSTLDAGESWTILNAGLSITQFYRLGASQLDPDWIVAGSQDNSTLSRRAGIENWEAISYGDGMEAAFHPLDENIMMTSAQMGVFFYSTNGFKTSRLITPDSLMYSGAWSTPFFMDPQRTDVMYTGYRRVYRISDFGTTWEPLTPVLDGSTIESIGYCFDQPQHQYLLTANGRIYRTADAWENYEIIGESIPRQGGRPMHLHVHPHDPQIAWLTLNSYQAGAKVFRTSDFGKTWESRHANLPQVPVHTAIIERDNPNEAVFLGTELGVWYRDNNMEQWQHLNKGMPGVLVNDFDINYRVRKIRAATYGRGVWEMPLPGSESLPARAQVNVHLRKSDDCAYEFFVRDHSVPSDVETRLSVEPSSGVSFRPALNEQFPGTIVTLEERKIYTLTLHAQNSRGKDSMSVKLDARTAGPIVPPLIESFDDWPLVRSKCALKVELPGGWENVPPEAGVDDIDWTIDAGPLQPAYDLVGPKVDNTRGDLEGRYLGLSTEWCYSQWAALELPCLDLSGGTRPQLRYAYYMNGLSDEEMGLLTIDVFVDGELIENIIEPHRGNHGLEWHERTVDLTPYRGESVKVRFRGLLGTYAFTDLALDDISVVFLPAKPRAQFDVDRSQICLGDTLTLTNRSINQPEDLLWTITPPSWRFAEGSDERSDAPKLIFEAGGDYSVSLLARNDLGRDEIEKRDVVQVQVVEQALINHVAAFELRASVEADSYQWFKDGDLLDVNTRTLTIEDIDAVYTLRIAVGNCVSELSDPVRIVSTSIAEVDASVGTFSIEPNPYHSVFTVRGELRKTVSNAVLHVSDVMGRELFRQTLQVSDLTIRHEVDMHAFAAGMYLVTLEIDGELLVLRTVKR